MEWVFRLEQELKEANNASFLTLTYDDENIVWAGDKQTLYKKDLQNFWKRLRKQKYIREPQKGIKYYACGEYGGQTQRPHYHAIVFNHPNSTLDNSKMETIWGKGIVSVDQVTTASIAYVTGYMIKERITPEELDERTPEFACMSQNLGLAWLTKKKISYIQKQELIKVNFNGKQISLPKYYRKKAWLEYSKKINRELSKYRKRKSQMERSIEAFSPIDFNSEETRLEYVKAQKRRQKLNNKKRNAI